MSKLDSFAAIIFGCFIIWRLYVYIRSKPEALSKESINKSSNTMMWLLVGLTVFIGVVAMLI